jgi:hypothetical protein
MVSAQGTVTAREDAILGAAPIRSSAIVDLNVVRMRLSSNRPSFAGLDYFSRFAEPSETPDYEVTCVDVDEDRIDLDAVRALSDETFRGKRFRDGFYLVHYFGDPAHLVSRGRRYHVFGRKLEKTVWPYFVKQILTTYSVDNDFLHLKAAGFVHDGGATLLVGRNGAGKTVFLTQACLGGADFLANTHVLTRDTAVWGVPSAIRIREGACFDELIRGHRLERHLGGDDFITSPERLFDGRTTSRAPVRNIVIVDYRPDRPRRLERLPAQTMTDFLEQFSLGVTVYGLKDDLLVHRGGDFDEFARTYRDMKERLATLTAGVRCFYANVDMLDAAERKEVLGVLGQH